MNLFEDIKTGLEQAIEYEKGELKVKTKTIKILPVSHFDAKEIRAIRIMTGLTQSAFASYMGVSVKTVEAWEAGRNRPEGASCRMLALTKQDPKFPLKCGIVGL